MKGVALLLVEIALLAAAAPAAAQAVGTLALESDAMFRGRSLSDGQPAAVVGISHDWRSGAHAGVDLLVTAPRDGGVNFLGVVTEAGYAHRFASGLSIDGGLVHRAYSNTYTPGFSVNFLEAYVDVSRGDLGLRMALAPDYFDRGATTLHIEAEIVRRLRSVARLSLRGGVLAVLDDAQPPRTLQSRWDVRAGAAHDFGRLTFDAAIHATGPTPDRLRDGTERRVTATLGARFAF